MNNCIFTTHHTLTKEHAIHSLRSLLQLQDSPIVWDNFVVYNTHTDEIDNEWLTKTIMEMDTHGYIKDMFVFPYPEGEYQKTLTQDTINHLQLLVENELNAPGKTLLLKSDYCVSNNFNRVFQEQSNINFLWSLPIYNAKEKVDMELVYERLKLDTFIPSDEVTYYRGGTNEPLTPGTMDNPYKEITPIEGHIETHPQVLFVSHNIQNDYNLHVFSNDILNICLQISKRVFDVRSTWGGAHDIFNVSWREAGITRLTEIRAFGVHMYHGIVSPNRNGDRTDARKVIDGERY